MSLKGKLLSAVASKTFDVVVNQVDKKLQSQKVEEKVSKPSTTDRKGNILPAYEYISKTPNPCYIIETKSFHSLSQNEFKGKNAINFSEDDGRYKIYDKNEKLQYVAIEKAPSLGEELVDKDLGRLFLYDLKGKVIGYSKEHFIAINLPLLEKEAKKYSIFLDKTKLCTVRHTISLGSDSFEMYESENCDYDFDYINNTEFTIKKGKKILAKIKIFRPTLKQLFSKTIVVECFDETISTVAILYAITVDTLCMN